MTIRRILYNNKSSLLIYAEIHKTNIAEDKKITVKKYFRKKAPTNH